MSCEVNVNCMSHWESHESSLCFKVIRKQGRGGEARQTGGGFCVKWEWPKQRRNKKKKKEKNDLTNRSIQPVTI